MNGRIAVDLTVLLKPLSAGDQMAQMCKFKDLFILFIKVAFFIKNHWQKLTFLSWVEVQRVGCICSSHITSAFLRAWTIILVLFAFLLKEN